MDEMLNVREPRLHTLTAKGEERFEFYYGQLHDKYETHRVKLLQHITELASVSTDEQKLISYETDLYILHDKLLNQANELASFLVRNVTARSGELQHAVSIQMDHVKKSMDKCVESIEIMHRRHAESSAQKQEQLQFDSASQVPSQEGKSASSHRSSLSSIQFRKRAKANAAMAKLAFSTREAELRKQQAILNEQEQLNSAKSKREQAFIDAELKLISDKKEIVATVAEADCLDQSFTMNEDGDEKSLSNHSLKTLGSVNPMDRVKQYVQNNEHIVPQNAPPHSRSHLSALPSHISSLMPDVSSISIHDESISPSVSKQFPVKSPRAQLPVTDDILSLSQATESKPKSASIPLNPGAKTFVPTGNNDHLGEARAATEIGQFFLKKELLISRLCEFNEKPENYEAWKTSFKRLVGDLNLSPSDELEMLGKWLGPTTKKYAQSYRNSNMSDPARGVWLLWERLDRCYGAPEEIEASLLRRLHSFEPITHDNPKRYYDLVDLLSEIESLQRNKRYKAQLAVFDTSSGVTPVAKKLLPPFVYEKWMMRASNYKLEHDVTFPPFSVFVSFIKDMCRIRNDPSFTYQSTLVSSNAPKHLQSRRKPPEKPKVLVKKTSVDGNDCKTLDVCPIHLTKHTLNECRSFRAKPIFVRRKFLNDNNICFGCCLSKDHDKKNCTLISNCSECKSKEHPTALHINFKPKTQGEGEKSPDHKTHKDNGGEQDKPVYVKTNVTPKCTEVCGKAFQGKSCAKIILVRVYHKDEPRNKVLTYAILDEQSNQSLVKSQLFTSLNIDSQEIEYTITSCSGLSSSAGRIAEGCVVESYDGTVNMNLPPLIECDSIPENRQEIPTPDVAASYSHLQDIEPFIQPLQDAQTLLLIGRDMSSAHHVLDQRLPDDNHSLPYAQKLRLGWVVVGESCLGKVHKPNITVNKTQLLSRGRPTMFLPCENNIFVKERDIGDNVFAKTANDNRVGMSVEDKEFLRIMDNDFSKNDAGNWQAPLPFRANRPTLPNNRAYTLHRARNLHNSLMKDKQKCQHMVDFVQKMIERGHAEVAPALVEGEECWYLPVFGVYHPQKPGQVRAVFDSSAQYQGVSLNSVLLSGPDLNNSLLEVLLRFRKEAVAITADIEQMFHSFLVKETHRNFLRFFWYENNDPNKQLIEYRMKVHLFGNSPSPAVACYGLLKTADNSEHSYGSDVKSFIYNNFYVDDGLISIPSCDEAIDLLERTSTALKQEGNLRLHKFASNCAEVMQALPSEDLAKDLKNLDFNNDILPVQRSLGLTWDLETDNFTFRVTNLNKPYTKRGVLSVINSLYDPLGFAGPVTITGKLFLRKVMRNQVNWDDPLPAELEPEWENWKDSLNHLDKIFIPRRYTFGDATFRDSTKDLLIYSDASEDAIAAVAYIRTSSSEGKSSVRFAMGKSKVAPSHGHSMPRLELCAAVLATEVHDAIDNALQVQFRNVSFYTDSRIVLGYIYNRTRRFFMYVSNRVERIHQSSKPEQWNYVSTKSNPADGATRSVSTMELENSQWLHGPTLCEMETETTDNFPLVQPDSDLEVKPEVRVLTTAISSSLPPLTERLRKYSDWTSVLRTVSTLSHITSKFFDKSGKCHGWHVCPEVKLPHCIEAARIKVLRLVQEESFSDEIDSLETGNPVSRKSPLYGLDPYLDNDKLIRVGGRLGKSKLSFDEKYPIVLPRNHHVSLLLVRHYHQRVHHQGRHITQGALRSAGYWIIGEKRLISSMIHHCLICKKFRGNFATQKMSNLPDDRLTPAPPFSYVGIDVFGPWNIVYRRTKGSVANTKRWAVLFTCLAIRAIHIEILEDMTSSCFVNALRRFICVRGPVRELRSDRGTNFIGSVDDLKVNVINVEDPVSSSYLNSEGITWKFNPPHSSHMGGVWERMIGVARKILDSLLSTISGSSLTHEVLVTFMYEVMAIVNARPLVSVSSDPNNPFVLSPSVILTQKTTADIRPFDNIDMRDMYKAQWRRVQCLAESFWKRWSREFLQTLQKRNKWQDTVPNIKDGDVVLMKQTDLHRNNWPIGIVTNAIPSDDGRVRKAEVRVMKDGAQKIYTRPITELVLLLSE